MRSYNEIFCWYSCDLKERLIWQLIQNIKNYVVIFSVIWLIEYICYEYPWDSLAKKELLWYYQKSPGHLIKVHYKTTFIFTKQSLYWRKWPNLIQAHPIKAFPSAIVRRIYFSSIISDMAWNALYGFCVTLFNICIPH